MVTLSFPPTMDSPRETCFCGRKTVESHDFLFCSPDCARQDSLRSLSHSNSHYRNVVRNAYAQEGAQPPQDYKTLKRIAPWIDPPAWVPPHSGNMPTGRPEDFSNIGVPKDKTKKSSLAALLKFGRSRKEKEEENHERLGVFGQPMDTIALPVRTDPRRMGRTL